MKRTKNMFALPPLAYVDCEDDANPTLKSLVLSQYAMDAIIHGWAIPQKRDRH